MKRIFLLIAFFAVLLDMPFLFAECVGPECLPEDIRQICVEEKRDGCIDWENHILYAVGIAAPNPKFKTKAQQYTTAVKAARINAQANLLEMVQEVQITSAHMVKDRMYEQGMETYQLKGLIKHFSLVGKPAQLSNGAIIVTGRMFLKDIREFMAERKLLPNERDSGNVESGRLAPPPDTSEKTGLQLSRRQSEEQPERGEFEATDRADRIYNGLIVDTRGFGIKPVTYPNILDERGMEVYGSTHIDHAYAIRQGTAGYTKSIERARKSPRFGTEGAEPLEIRATGQGKTPFDVVISNKDAVLLRKLNATQTFLREGRVMIVVD